MWDIEIRLPRSFRRRPCSDPRPRQRNEWKATFRLSIQLNRKHLTGLMSCSDMLSVHVHLETVGPKTPIDRPPIRRQGVCACCRSRQAAGVVSGADRLRWCRGSIACRGAGWGSRSELSLASPSPTVHQYNYGRGPIADRRHQPHLPQYR